MECFLGNSHVGTFLSIGVYKCSEEGIWMVTCNKFGRDTLIIDALRIHPQARAIFTAHGMGCIGCMGSEAETIENGARMHGINVDALLSQLNSLLEN
jgi:hybrid cluster-associated redox disulfide protein